MKNQFKFNQPLTYSEQERLAYISGDTELADSLDKLMEYEGDTDGYDIDDALDEVGMYGLRGEKLYDAMCELKREKDEAIQEGYKLVDEVNELQSELGKYKKAFEDMKGFTRISQVKELIDKIDDEDS